MFRNFSIVDHRSILPLLTAATIASCGTLAAQSPSDSEDIRPAKEEILVPLTLQEKLEAQKATILLWSGIGGGALLLIIFLLLLMKHFSKKKADGPARLALRSLEELQAGQDGMGAEAFAYLTAKTVRQYIADRFGLAAPRRTTEEFLRDLVALGHSSPLAGESEYLGDFLKACDVAKYSEANLDSTQRNELLGLARRFVQATSTMPQGNGGPA